MCSCLRVGTATSSLIHLMQVDDSASAIAVLMSVILALPEVSARLTPGFNSNELRTTDLFTDDLTAGGADAGFPWLSRVPSVSV